MSLREGQWDKELEFGLPDSRLSGHSRVRKQRRVGRITYEQIFCASCGANGGYVTAEWSPHVFYVCDSCVAKQGPPPGAIELGP